MSGEGTTGYCLLPRALWELMEGWREHDSSVLHLILDPSLLRR